MTVDSKAFDRLTTFERRQRILTLLEEHAGIRVAQMAGLLAVSEGTIRNDLRALAQRRQITRVRGGAVPQANFQARSPAFTARARLNIDAKQQIARWAADLVQDGDSILLDASTTVYHLAHYLSHRHHLTVITNGLEVGLALAQNSTHKVILLGGLLRADGTSVTGPLAEKLLGDLHIKMAFVSCSGLSMHAGLTDVDIQEAQLKREMISSAETLVALVDSTKFGRADLTSFARLGQVSRIITDSQVLPGYLEQLSREGVMVTICDDTTARSIMPHGDLERNGHLKIGYANLSDEMPFALDVRRGLERAAREAGNIDLVLADNQLDGDVALDVADRLIAEGVDLAIEFQIDEKAGNLIMARYRQAGIPVIAVDIPMVGGTFFGADNYRAGQMAGLAMGQWIRKHWGGKYDRLILIEEPRAGALPAARMRGQLDGLISVLGDAPEDKLCHVDSQNRTDISAAHMVTTLKSLAHEHRLAILSFNDDSAMGAIQAARALGRETDIAVAGQGADRRAREELRRPGTPLIGTTAYTPEEYGPQLLALAGRILRREAVPPAVYVDHIFVTPANVDIHYPDWAKEDDRPAILAHDRA